VWAANAGGFASIKRNLAALETLSTIERRLVALSERDPSFGDAAAYRALASIYFNTPPLISVGSKKKALSYAQRAFAAFPANPGNILILGQVKADDGDTKAASQLFKDALSLAVVDRYPLDYAAWRWEAHQALCELGVLLSSAHH
jgi:hypothetical protein